MQRILTVVGARPQFIKASVVSKAIQTTAGIDEVVLHTGQHFDTNMSDIFFNQLDIPKPDVQLDINGGRHGEMTGRMLVEIEEALIKFRPDRLLVYGDTNSTLAGALAAAKLHIPVAHIEAGLRSFNMAMPEEVNRILTDQVSDLLFCPTQAAKLNLEQEGFGKKSVKVLEVGDVMQDAAIMFSKKSKRPKHMKIPAKFILTTLHRAENTDSPERLKNIVFALNEIHKTQIPILMPIHPRTKKLISRLGLDLKVNLIDPVGYLEMVWLMNNCELIMTDSGGVQKEAFFFRKPCVTMRDETEWVELVSNGANKLVGACKEKIISGVLNSLGKEIVDNEMLFGGGEASKKIVDELLMDRS